MEEEEELLEPRDKCCLKPEQRICAVVLFLVYMEEKREDNLLCKGKCLCCVAITAAAACRSYGALKGCSEQCVSLRRSLQGRCCCNMFENDFCCFHPPLNYYYC